MVVHAYNPSYWGGWGRNRLNPGGGACTELRSHHCTPAWVTKWDSVSPPKKIATKWRFIFRLSNCLSDLLSHQPSSPNDYKSDLVTSWLKPSSSLPYSQETIQILSIRWRCYFPEFIACCFFRPPPFTLLQTFHHPCCFTDIQAYSCLRAFALTIPLV